MIAFLLNIPYTFLACLAALISFPTSVSFYKNPYAIIFTIKKFWWKTGFYKNNGEKFSLLMQTEELYSQALYFLENIAFSCKDINISYRLKRIRYIKKFNERVG